MEVAATGPEHTGWIWTRCMGGHESWPCHAATHIWWKDSPLCKASAAAGVRRCVYRHIFLFCFQGINSQPSQLGHAHTTPCCTPSCAFTPSCPPTPALKQARGQQPSYGLRAGRAQEGAQLLQTQVWLFQVAGSNSYNIIWKEIPNDVCDSENDTEPFITRASTKQPCRDNGGKFLKEKSLNTMENI